MGVHSLRSRTRLLYTICRQQPMIVFCPSVRLIIYLRQNSAFFCFDRQSGFACCKLWAPSSRRHITPDRCVRTGSTVPKIQGIEESKRPFLRGPILRILLPIFSSAQCILPHHPSRPQQPRPSILLLSSSHPFDTSFAFPILLLAEL